MTQVSVHIPGKVMLAGEYSVLYGGRALAATVKHQMVVTASGHAPGTCRLTSNLWPDPLEVQTSLPASGDLPPFVISALAAVKKHHLDGAAVSVSGSLDPAHGFGSSSALRLGTSIALKTLATGRQADTYWEEAIEAYHQQRAAQQRASGYDIVTQYMGGLTLYAPGQPAESAGAGWPGRITTFPPESVRRLNQIFHVFVGGKGAPTTETMRSTTSWMEDGDRKTIFVQRSEQLIDCILATLQARSGDLSDLIAAVREHRLVFAGAPAYPAWLDQVLGTLPGADSAFSWKTTGAGGEDAVLLIGTDSDIEAPAAVLQGRGWERILRPFTPEGASVQIQQAATGEVHA
jgi:mevalonate kinase